jgi:membrane protease YdiL (CAAX protease family)
LIGDVAFVLALAVVPDVVISLWTLATAGPCLPGTGAHDSVWLIARSLQVAVPVVWLQSRSAEPLERLGLRRTPIGIVLAGGILLCGVTLGLTLLLDALLGLPDPPPLVEGTSATASGGLLVLAVLASAANAFAEEIAIRGFLFDRLERLTGSAGVAVLASSLAFAGYHAYQGGPALLGILVFGLVFGLVFAVTRLLAPLVVAHAMINVLAVVG